MSKSFHPVNILHWEITSYSIHNQLTEATKRVGCKHVGLQRTYLEKTFAWYDKLTVSFQLQSNTVRARAHAHTRVTKNNIPEAIFEYICLGR